VNKNVMLNTFNTNDIVLSDKSVSLF